jgi:hypothetical protein
VCVSLNLYYSRQKNKTRKRKWLCSHFPRILARNLAFDPLFNAF